MPAARRDRGLIALIIGSAVGIAGLLGTFVVFHAQQQAQGWVLHTLQVRAQLSAVLAHLHDAETGQRGFLVTHDESYLEPYVTGTRRLPGDLKKLQTLISDNPLQLAAVKRIASCSADRLRRLEAGLAAARADRFDLAGQAVLASQGKVVMDRCRAEIDSMQVAEARLFERRIADARSRTRNLVILLALSAIIMAASALFAISEARRRARLAWAARDALAESNAQLVEEAANREQAEAQIRQMQKMESIGQLTGGVAHDFNNMLAIVIGSLDLAKRRLETDKVRAAACIDNAMQGAERAAQLTARLLAFSRQQPLAPRAIDLNKLVSGMSELLRRTIGENVRFETVLAGGLWPAHIDGAQLENAVINLCVNARDAMPDGGRLTIETANTHLDDAYAAQHGEVTAGQYVMVSVTDTGSGMTPEVIERAFDPFFTTKGTGKGTGLGLSQVFGFVKQSGGHVKIYSELDVGTTVKLYLPRYFGSAEAAASDALTRDEPLPLAKDGEVVLVVEDEESVRQFSVDALRELGYEVLEAGNPKGALALIEAQPRIDLLFTDVIMPDMSGRKLAELAREQRPELKVLYTTGYTKNAIVHNGVLDHDVAFLAKPFTLQQLAVKVRSVIDGGI